MKITKSKYKNIAIGTINCYNTDSYTLLFTMENYFGFVDAYLDWKWLTSSVSHADLIESISSFAIHSNLEEAANAVSQVLWGKNSTEYGNKYSRTNELQHLEQKLKQEEEVIVAELKLPWLVIASVVRKIAFDLDWELDKIRRKMELNDRRK